MEGIEYYSAINPTNIITSKELQLQYTMEYKIAEHTFYSELYVSKDIIKAHLDKNSSYELTVDFSASQDEIKTNTDYGVKFLKSVFLLDKQREVISTIRNYYSDFIVTGPFLNINGESKRALFLITKKLPE